MTILGLIINSILNKNELTIIKYVDYRYYWEEMLEDVKKLNK
jgi:hypothetical protein